MKLMKTFGKLVGYRYLEDKYFNNYKYKLIKKDCNINNNIEDDIDEFKFHFNEEFIIDEIRNEEIYKRIVGFQLSELFSDEVIGGCRFHGIEYNPEEFILAIPVITVCEPKFHIEILEELILPKFIFKKYNNEDIELYTKSYRIKDKIIRIDNKKNSFSKIEVYKFYEKMYSSFEKQGLFRRTKIK